MPKTLTFPADESAIRALRVGDDVRVSGRILTGRDRVHRHLAGQDDRELRALTAGAAVYHCAPVVSQDPVTREYRVVAAGPTVSMREEPWEADVLARYGIRAIIGKGGMGPRTLAALAAHGAAYLHAVGGLAVVLARCFVRVRSVHRLDEFGVAEALWELEAHDFPAVVTMDAHGGNLHAASDTDPELLAKELIDARAR